MKEKEAKKIAARKRLEEKSKKKTEEENAVRKGEALQVRGGCGHLPSLPWLARHLWSGSTVLLLA